MYEEFYGLSAKPFSKTPDPAFLFHSKMHEEALARLRYAVDEKEIMVLTGEIGSGKTTLSRTLIDELDPDRYKVILILNPRLNATQFMKTFAERLGDGKGRFTKNSLLNEQVTNYIYDFYRKGITPVVIIDEAQLINSKEVFDELRLITNFQLDDENLISLILLGQPELRDNLNRDSLEPFRQRIGIHYHLTNLDYEDTASYVRHRLGVAGRPDCFISDAAIRAVFDATAGVPRRINNVLTSALLVGFGLEHETIDDDVIAAVLREESF